MIKQYQKIRLKDGKDAIIVEILGDGTHIIALCIDMFNANQGLKVEAL